MVIGRILSSGDWVCIKFAVCLSVLVPSPKLQNGD